MSEFRSKRAPMKFELIYIGNRFTQMWRANFIRKFQQKIMKIR